MPGALRGHPPEGRQVRQLAAGLARQGWPGPLIRRLLEASQPVRFRAAQTLYRDGSSAQRMFWLVEGVVKVGQARDGKQPIQIDWNVYDPGGKKLGTVSQKNEVPQGSLDGSWGKTADAAAQAAAQGIVKLLPVSKTN